MPDCAPSLMAFVTGMQCLRTHLELQSWKTQRMPCLKDTKLRSFDLRKKSCSSQRERILAATKQWNNIRSFHDALPIVSFLPRSVHHVSETWNGRPFLKLTDTVHCWKTERWVYQFVVTEGGQSSELSGILGAGNEVKCHVRKTAKTQSGQCSMHALHIDLTKQCFIWFSFWSELVLCFQCS